MTYPSKPTGNYVLRDYDFAQADYKKIPMDEYLFKNGYKNAEESDTESVPDAHEQNWFFDVLHRNLRYAIGTAEENKTRLDGLRGSTDLVTENSGLNLTSGGAYTYLVRRASSTTGTGSVNQPIYVKADGQISACNTMVNITTDQNISGVKTFNNTVIANIDGNCSGSSGSCTGNSATATMSTQDGIGRNIVDTYATKAELTTEVNNINTNLGGRWYINNAWWNGQSGYIVWSGGLCLQWGYAYAQQSASTRIALYKTYNDTTYNVQVTGRTIVIDGDWDLGTKAGYAESQNTIILRSSRTRAGDTNYAYWQTLGFLASGQY